MIGFNDGLLDLAENSALGPGFFRQNTSGYALGVLTPKASPLGWVFSQAQQPIIETYSMEASIGPGNNLTRKDPNNFVTSGGATKCDTWGEEVA